MKPRRLLLPTAVVAAAVAVALAGGGDTEVEPAHDAGPATVEQGDGGELRRVLLTRRAAERTGVETEPVRTTSEGTTSEGLTVPYSALIYDPHGDTWVYTSPERLAYVRAPVEVTRIDGDLVYLREGPAGGTAVVTAGAAELYGTEFEVGH